MALVAGALVFTSAYAFAATLGVSANSLGAGNTSVSSCTANATVSYTLAYASSIPGYRIDTVTVSGLGATACAGKNLSVQLTGTSNAALGSTPLSATNIAAGTSYTFDSATVSSQAGVVNAASVTGASVAISG